MPAWSAISTPSTGGNPINDICCGGPGIFVAVGTGVVLTSTDAGRTWDSQTPAEANIWRGIAYNGSVLVAVSSNGTNRVMTSVDNGVTWVSRSAAEANQWQSVTWASFLSLFVAVSSTGVNRVMTSPDGITWTARAAASAKSWSHVAASSTLVMAYEITTETTMTSADAVTWANGAASPSTFNLNISGGSNQFVYSAAAQKFAVAGRDTGTLTAKVVFTTTSAAWTSNTAAPLSDFAWFQGAFFAADSVGGFYGWLQESVLNVNSPYIGISTDGGSTWEADDTGITGSWSVGAWDPVTGTAVFWDGELTNRMLVGTNSAVTSITPNAGTIAGGTAVTITGRGFNLPATGVTFGGVAATDVVIVSDTQITAVTPAHASGAVDVEVLGIGTLTDGYTYTVPTLVLPHLPYTSPLIEHQPNLMTLPWFRWFDNLRKQIVTGIDVVPAEDVVGVLSVDNIPDLPVSKLEMTGPRLVGRSDDGIGPAEEIILAAGLSLVNGILSVAGLPGGYTIGDLLYADSATSLALLNDVSVGSYLRSGGVATAPLWSTVKIPNTATTGDLWHASATDTMTALAAVAAGRVLRAAGVATAPAYSTFTIPDTFAQGDLIYGSASNVLTALAKNTNATRYLSNTGASNNPAWAQVDLTNGVTGVLPVANGGSGTSTVLTAGSVIFAGASGVYSQDNANFFWDDTNNRLGIKTAAAPGVALDINDASGFRVRNGATDGFNWTQSGSNQWDIQALAGGHTLRLTSSNFLITSGNLSVGTTTLPGTGTNGIVWGDGNAFASMGSNTAGAFANDVGGTVEFFGINEANEVSRLTGQLCRNSAQFDKTTSTALATVTGLSRNVAASTVYKFEAVLFITADATGGSKFAINGSATATAILYDITLLDEGTDAYTIVSRQTALAGSAGQAGTTSGLCRISGTIVVNAAGTLTVEFAQNASNGTSSVLANSSFEITQVG